jgi:hypothetical protein
MAERTPELVVLVLGERAAAVALILDRGNQHRAGQVATVGLRRPNGQSPELQHGVATGRLPGYSVAATIHC